MTLDEIIAAAIDPALKVLPQRMDSPEARVMLLAIGLQESRFEHRYQVLEGGKKGAARSFWECERAGVNGVMRHPASRRWLSILCVEREVPFGAMAIWKAIENDDVLAAGVARLLLWTDPHPLPQVSDVRGSWELYLRCWRPGKPRPESWPLLHDMARAEVAP